jgi:phosphopantetheinyl transferase
MIVSSAQCALHYATFEELEIQSAATAIDWLSTAELDLWRQFRSTVRKSTFLAGRVLAKRLLRQQHCAAATCKPAQITIRSGGSSSTGVRPRATLSGHRLAYSLSISHTCDAVLVGGTNQFGMSVGVDLVRMRKLGAAFERSWLTETEAEFLRQYQDDMTVADIWAMKEAVYKACHRGESFAPRSVEIRLEPEGTTVYYHGRNLKNRCTVRIWRLGDEVAAVATYERVPARNGHASELRNGALRSLGMKPHSA